MNAVTQRTGTIGGVLSVVLAGFGSMLPSFWIALQTFWWCPEGGCSLRAAGPIARVVTNVAGWFLLYITFALIFWYLSALLFFRPWYTRAVSEAVFLPVRAALPKWYKTSMSAWVEWLWRGTSRDDA